MEEIIKNLQDSITSEIKDKENKMAILKDNLLSLNELITFNKKSRSGLSSQYMNAKVKKGEPLPKLFGFLTFDANDGKKYNIKITEIQAIQWVEDEDAIIVHFLGVPEEFQVQEENKKEKE
jgi:hypothetical protein